MEEGTGTAESVATVVIDLLRKLVVIFARNRVLLYSIILLVGKGTLHNIIAVFMDTCMDG